MISPLTTETFYHGGVPTEGCAILRVVFVRLSYDRQRMLMPFTKSNFIRDPYSFSNHLEFKCTVVSREPGFIDSNEDQAHNACNRPCVSYRFSDAILVLWRLQEYEELRLQTSSVYFNALPSMPHN